MSAPKKTTSFLRLVGGTEAFAGDAPSRRKTQRSKSRLHTLKRNDLDPIFFAITRHRAAFVAYEFAVQTGQHSSHLHADLLLMSRIVVLTEPTTRRGLIALAKYLDQQFDMEADCDRCVSMDDKIGREPWPKVALKTLRRALSHMAPELGK